MYNPIFVAYFIRFFRIDKNYPAVCALSDYNPATATGVEKMVFKVVIFCGFLKNQKILKGRIFCFFMVF